MHNDIEKNTFSSEPATWNCVKQVFKRIAVSEYFTKEQCWNIKQFLEAFTVIRDCISLESRFIRGNCLGNALRFEKMSFLMSNRQFIPSTSKQFSRSNYQCKLHLKNTNHCMWRNCNNVHSYFNLWYLVDAYNKNDIEYWHDIGNIDTDQP